MLSLQSFVSRAIRVLVNCVFYFLKMFIDFVANVAHYRFRLIISLTEYAHPFPVWTTGTVVHVVLN